MAIGHWLCCMRWFIMPICERMAWRCSLRIFWRSWGLVVLCICSIISCILDMSIMPIPIPCPIPWPMPWPLGALCSVCANCSGWCASSAKAGAASNAPVRARAVRVL
ncbi:hypothetical protein D9M68_733260 [compost metagenome]